MQLPATLWTLRRWVPFLLSTGEPGAINSGKLSHGLSWQPVELWRRRISSFALSGGRKEPRGEEETSVSLCLRVATIRAGEKIG